MAETTETTTETMTETNLRIVTLSDAAQNMARKFLAQEADPTNKALRVRVDSGGCFGFQYAVEIDARKDDDLVLTYDGFDVVVDSVSREFLEGATLDYVDTIGHAGFKFENPKATGSCGCGTSFDVE